MGDISRAYTYPQIKTPEAIDDVHTYICPDISLDRVKGIWRNLTEDLQQKLTVVAERLEFIEKLNVIKSDISSNHKITKSSYLKGSGNLLIENIFECTYLDADFAGVPHDIEALQIYLLITCLDTIAGGVEYKNPFEWLREKYDGKPEITVESLKELENEYSMIHGLSRKFKELFQSVISDDLKAAWIDNYIVVSLIGGSNEQPGSINNDSYDAWQKKDVAQKISAIATELYVMRSKYTHVSSRKFERSLPISNLPHKRGKHLVRTGEQALCTLLLQSLRDVACKRLIERS